MKILAIETATNACSVALLNDKQITSAHRIAPRQHAEIVVPMIDELLTTSSVQLKDCDAIAYGAGPGSFMGIRLAVGLTQGLAFAANIPVISVSMLHTLAQTAYEEYGVTEALVGWDARMSQIYWGVYRCVDGLMQTVVDDQLSDPGAIDGEFAQCVAVGNAWQVYAEQLSSICRDLPKQTDCYPQATSMLKLAAAKFSEGEIAPAEQAQPLYLRDQVVG